MSKKDKIKKQKNDVQVSKKEAEKEKLSKGEKIFTYIMSIGGFLAILIIILVSIPYGGEKERISRKFDSLSVENVFEYIEYDEIRDKISKGEKFQVLFINSNQENCEMFIYYVDEIVKSYETNKEMDLQPIYIFDTSKIEKNTDQKKYFQKNVNSKIFDSPNLVFYEKTIYDYSVDTNSTCLYKISDYSDNYWRLILDYFEDTLLKEE